MPFRKSAVGDRSSASLLATLAFAALVPVACVLWFMNAAMRNERLAVQEQLTVVYSSHLASLQRHVTAFAKERQAALQAQAGNSPTEKFAAIVRAGLADGVVVYDAAGKVVYPTASNDGGALTGNADWTRARELQAQAAALLKAGQQPLALERLATLVSDSSLRAAVSAQGALIVPNAQLLILKVLSVSHENIVGRALRPTDVPTVSGINPDLHPGGDPFAALRQQTLDDLVRRLNDYAGGDLPSSQRRFLMAEVGALAPGTNPFPTQAAEELAAEYLEHNPALPTDSKLQPTPLAKVWRLPSADRSVVALFREDRLRAEIVKQLDSLALPDVRGSVLAPGEAAGSVKFVASQEVGELLPGWRLGLSFRDGDPLAEASTRQTRFYLWTGFLVVLVIATLALLVARYVNAQMRLARLKNELVSTVSHELKTPLASMRALVDTLLARRYSDPRQLDEYLQLVAKENLRLSHLIENFLAFSRMERGQQQFRFEDLPPQEVVRMAVDALGEKLTAAQCSFTLRLAPDLPPIRGDADALATVLINLLDNACKYANGDKRIDVRVYATNGLTRQPRHARKSGTDPNRGLRGWRGWSELFLPLSALSAQSAVKNSVAEKSSPLGTKPADIVPAPEWNSRSQTDEFLGRKKAQESAKTSTSFFAPFRAFLRPSPASPESCDAVVFEVDDNGIGLEPAEARKIFDRFYQVDQSLTRQRGGCGLGLSIVQSIVRAHRGVVEVESEPGKGSTFRVRIPVGLVTTLNAQRSTLNAQVTNHETAGGWLER